MVNVSWSISSGGPAPQQPNQPSTVSAGPGQEIMLPNVATLNDTCDSGRSAPIPREAIRFFVGNGIAAHIKTGVVCEAYVFVAVLNGRNAESRMVAGTSYAPAFFSIFAQVSLSGRVRLKTRLPGLESGSTQK